MLKNKQKQIFLFIAAIGLLIFLHSIKILRPVENAIVFALNPVANKIYSASYKLRTVYYDYNKKNNLINTVKNLELKNSQLIIENSRLKILEQENEILRQHLKFENQNKFNYILANIILLDAFNPQKYEQSIVIDKGIKDGIELGLSVVNSHGIVIGKVIDVKNYITKVALITDKNCKLAVSIQGEDATAGIAEGELGLTIRMNFIPKNKQINNEDIVVTSGLEKNIPKGLVIGKVIKVNQPSNKVWQNVLIEPLVNLDDLIIVAVVKNIIN